MWKYFHEKFELKIDERCYIELLVCVIDGKNNNVFLFI